jgi:hypothetical protein
VTHILYTLGSDTILPITCLGAFMLETDPDPDATAIIESLQPGESYSWGTSPVRTIERLS